MSSVPTMQQINMEFSQKLGVQFGGPCNKDYSILGSIFGVPLCRGTTIFSFWTGISRPKGLILPGSTAYLKAQTEFFNQEKSCSSLSPKLEGHMFLGRKPSNVKC